MPFDLLRDEDGLNLRDYQINAVQVVEREVVSGRKNILIAMATGLGEQAQDVFSTVKLEDLLPLDKIYNLNKLGDKTFGKKRDYKSPLSKAWSKEFFMTNTLCPA